MKKYWDGEESLSKSFWLLWVAGSLFFAIAGAALAFLGSFVASVSGFQLAFVTFLLLLFFNPYYILCWVSVWRSTKNTKIKLFNYGAKALVVLHAVSVILNISNVSEFTSRSF